MKQLARRLEELFIDITFAEDREFDSVKRASSKVAVGSEDTFTAIAFAESGEFETAASYINGDGEAKGSRRKEYPLRRFNKLYAGGT